MNTAIDEFFYICYDSGNNVFDAPKHAELIIREVLKEAYDEIQYATSYAIANEICETLERKFGIR